ncbi:MAG: hypothetical protein LBU98_00275 [Alistipes sp.]|jgi:hypothetical protein|nr:hypothetical protein [Alistipes sp.]
MKKLFMFAAAAALTFGMASCAKEGPGNGTEAEGISLLTIKLQNEAAGATRAPIASTAAESAVNSLEIYVFNAGGAARPTQEGTVTYVNVPSGDYNFVPTNDGSSTVSFNVPTGVPVDVLVVANANLGEMATSTMQQVMAALSPAAKTFTKTNNGAIFGAETPAVTTDDGFVMAGKTLNLTIVNDAEVAVNIDRNVVKIAPPEEDDTVTAELTPAEWEEIFPDAADGAFASVPAAGGTMPGFDFALTGFAVLNGLPKSAAGFQYTASPYNYNPGHAYLLATPFNYTNPWSNWDAGAFTYPYATGGWQAQITATNGATETLMGARLISNADNMMDLTEPEDVTPGNLTAWAPYSGWLTSLTTAVYAYESKPGQVTNNSTGYRGYNADQVISLIIGGRISITGLSAATRFWRVDIRPENGEAYHIIRNSIYTTLISKITSPGHTTPWEAENEDPIIDEPGATPTDFIISINPWDGKPVGNTEL